MGWLVHWCSRLLARAGRGRPSVTVDADGVAYRGERLEMAELAAVSILTTADGPFAADVFWVLQARQGARLVIPQDAPGSDSLLARLQTLPRFDNEAVLEAMGCTDAGAFLCWQSHDDT